MKRSATAAEQPAQGQGSTFRAGAAAVDVTPLKFPVVVSGMFTERVAQRAHDRLYARALVLDNGNTRLAIVVVDSLMLPRNLLDEAKTLACKATGIPAERMLISATHTHSAPSAMGALGSDADPHYPAFVTPLIARAIERAAGNLAPARVGWTVVKDHRHAHTRRWIFRPDRMGTDPFGGRTVRAHMHPGHESPNHIGPAGPDDPGLSLLSIQSLDGRPIAVLANYATHYFGSPLLSSDFCGRFGDKFFQAAGAADLEPAPVGIMSQGTSGDGQWRDYGKPPPGWNLDSYSEAVAQVAAGAYKTIEYHDWVPLAMAEAKLKLTRRLPDPDRLARARQTVEKLAGRKPRSLPEIYAREAIFLHERPQVELKLQAIRIGELGITALPNEVYAITGLKLKAQSPLAVTFNIELANGAQGYIPPPEQHALGGYTTWPARTAGLEVQAEPRIVETLLGLLEDVSGRPRQEPADPPGPYAQAVLRSKPAAYWRLGEIAGRRALDASGHGRPGWYEPGVALYLEGPAPYDGEFSGGETVNRAAHFAGGRMNACIDNLADTYSVELWFSNGLPHDVRPVTGYMFSRGPGGDKDAPGDHLGISGRDSDAAGRLIFFNGNGPNELLVGTTELTVRSWNHVLLVRDAEQVLVYLNGNTEPEISGKAQRSIPSSIARVFVGGRNDDFANFEGKLDEVAIYDRALTAREAAEHYQASGQRPPAAVGDSTAIPPPLSPAESLQAMHVHKGFRVELVAAEPLVTDPVAIAWGPDGKLWVVEMADYPLGVDGKGKPGGRVRFLEDTNGDGRYDRSTVFLDGVSFPNGVLPWRKGVLVTAAPEVFYAEDTDGDGKADRRETLFTGFKPGNPQLRINGLRWGLDNWIYCANGWSGGRAVSVKTGVAVSISGRDVRIRPDDGAVDAQSGVSQFGRNRDDWGNWFGVNNSYPMWHYVLADHYLRRNPHLAPPDVRVQLVLPPNPKVYPRSPILQRFNTPDQAGRFTSACQAMVYRDRLLFGAGELQHAFICEPVHNLVHHEVLTPHGLSFTARRSETETQSEFLASEDKWCRPVMTRTGPDGALWVVDMYRWINEHPQWMPKHVLKQLQAKGLLRAGHDRGRIYRIVPEGAKPRPIPRLQRLAAAELVAALDSPNGWQRDMVQQMLLWRNDPETIRPLELLAAGGHNPLARLHALCSLDGMGAPGAKRIEAALDDPHPGVRRHAVRLAESIQGNAGLIAAAALLVDDPQEQVRLQLACTLGQWRDARAAQALGRLLCNDYRDPYLTAAAMSSLNADNIERVIEAALQAPQEDPPAATLIGRLIAMAAAVGRNDVAGRAIAEAAGRDDQQGLAWQLGVLAELLDGLKRAKNSLSTLYGDSRAGENQTGRRIARVFDSARGLAADRTAGDQRRILAVRLLGRGPDGREGDLRLLGDLLVPQTPGEVQSAAVEALAKLDDPQVPEMLLAGWRGHCLALRGQILDVLLGRGRWTAALLEGLADGDVLRSEVDPARRERLFAHKDAALRARAKELLAGASSPDRKKVLQQYRSVLQISGDPKRGSEVFKKNCANCHRFDGQGHQVGPDLAALTDRSPGTLLGSILDPNATVDSRYLGYVAVAGDGRSYTGLLAAETSSSITLVDQNAKQHVLLRVELEELAVTGKSHMPEGLEEQISKQQFADLLAHLASGRPHKTYPGNEPALVTAAPDGRLELRASNCEIFGSTVVLERKYGNLGYWHAVDNRAVWTVEVPAAQDYSITLDYACDDGTAGNRFILDSDGGRFVAEVVGTGSWDTYQRRTFGSITLAAGRRRITFRPGEDLRGALIDLRSITLRPHSAQ